MNLYERDYMTLTSDEEKETQALEEQNVVNEGDTLKLEKPRFRKYPKAARHHKSLFPNNYLDIVDLQEDAEQLRSELTGFKELLNSKDVKERKILNFIKENRSWFIIASLCRKYFDFGHHEIYLFPEFQLGNSYQVDYLIIGKNSGGYEFVFVELEAPNGKITIADGNLGEAFRNGEIQVNDWRTWLQSHYSSLRETLDKSRQGNAALPDEFVTLNTSRLHFVVICGRRDNFKDKTYQLRREKEQLNVWLLHYDNLIDASNDVIGRETY